MRHRMRKHAQTWSIDLLMAAGLFLLTFVVFYYILGMGSSDETVKRLTEESNLIPLKFISVAGQNSSLVFIIDNKVDVERLRQVSNLTYLELKNQMGLSSEFCIYFEDENGNLINLSPVTGQSGVGIGSQRINISNSPCGSR